jgi:hypothetical protein
MNPLNVLLAIVIVEAVVIVFFVNEMNRLLTACI